MGTTLGGIGEYFDPGLTLQLCSPVACGSQHRHPWPCGREYVVPLADAELGLWCRTVAPVMGRLNAASTKDEIAGAVAQLESVPDPPAGRGTSLEQYTLGAVYGQMVADGVPDPYITYCGITAFLWIAVGEEAAATWWRSGGRPEAARPAPNRAERRATQQAGSSPTTSTGGAPTTRSPGSGSGTNSRRSGRRKGSRSRGKPS